MPVVSIPRVLAVVTGDRRNIEVDGTTVRGALDDLVRRYPQLAVHLWDEAGAWRPHVVCLVDGHVVRWNGDEQQPVGSDADITVVQAVSGGFSTWR